MPASALQTKTARRLGRGKLLLLWISYQRYVFLLLALAAGVVLVPLRWFPVHWRWWGLPVLLVALQCTGLAAFVLRRWPRKLRATLVAMRRIRRGGFEVQSVSPYCNDPCFRVVARQILREAGLGPHAIRATIKRLRTQPSKLPHIVLRSADTGVAITVEGRAVSLEQFWENEVGLYGLSTTRRGLPSGKQPPAGLRSAAAGPGDDTAPRGSDGRLPERLVGCDSDGDDAV